MTQPCYEIKDDSSIFKMTEDNAMANKNGYIEDIYSFYSRSYFQAKPTVMVKRPIMQIDHYK